MPSSACITKCRKVLWRSHFAGGQGVLLHIPVQIPMLRRKRIGKFNRLK